MTVRRTRVGLGAAALVVLLLGVPAGATPRRTVIVVRPAFGPPTTAVSVQGAGFGSAEVVTLRVGSRVASSATTGSDGRFTGTAVVPADQPPGNTTIRAVGQTSGLRAGHAFQVRTDWAFF